MNVEDCSLHKMTHSEMDDTVTHCDFNTRDVSLLGSNHIHGTANAQHRTCLYTQFCSRFYKLIIKGCARSKDLCGSCFPSVQVATKTGPLWMKARH